MHCLRKIGFYSFRYLCAVAVSLLGISCLNVASAKKIDVRIAWYILAPSPTDTHGVEFAKNLKKDSKGQINPLTYPGGSLMTEANIVNGIKNNTVQMGILGTNQLSGISSALQWDNIPYLVDDPDTALTMLHGKLGQEFNKVLKHNNLIVIGWGFYGFGTSFINNKHQVKVPADLKGLSIRSDGPLTSAFIKKFHGTPISMSSSEAYASMMQGVIGGSATGLQSVWQHKWYEAAPYVTALRSHLFVYPIIANLKWWNGLTKEQRAIISKAAADTEEPNVKAITATWDNVVKKLGSEKSVHLYVPKGDDLGKWKQGAVFLRKEYARLSGAEGANMLKIIESYKKQ